MTRRLLPPVLAAALLLSSAAHAQRGGAAEGGGPEVHDTLRLYYVGHGIGYERYSLARTGAGDSAYTLTADYDYTDRGRRTHVAASATTTADFAPRHLAITRFTDSSATVETRIDVRGGRARVVYRGDSSTVAMPRGAVVIAGTSPLSQHLLVLRAWARHGRPRTMRAIPGGPTNELTITHRGRDSLRLGARRVVLDRYAVNGVTWGVEALWLDDAGRLAALSTTGGGLTMDAVRLSLEPLLPALLDIATRDRVADMARLSRALPVVASGTMVLVGGTLIDGTGHAPVRDAAVVVANGRIVAAGPRATVDVPRGIRRIDVTGRTIMPGLWDMHTHVMQMEWAPVYLAAGVTSARDMGSNLYFIVPYRAAIEAGRIVGPHLVLAGLVDGGGPNAFGAVTATTPEEGRAVVQHYHALGFEQMKLYDLLAPDVVGAITAEAHRLGMTVTGHVPRALGLLASIDSGMDQVAHLQVRGDSSADSTKRQIRALREHGTVVDPTASWGELLGHSTAEPVSALIPGVANLPPVLAQRVRAMGVATIDTATAHGRMRRTLGVIRALYDAGVPLVPGTDEGVPAYSVYRELELYAAAGIPPMAVLQTATLGAARAAGMERRSGSVEPGKVADLIVLDGNPLENLRNLQRVRLVMSRGTLYRSADLWRAAGFRPSP